MLDVSGEGFVTRHYLAFIVLILGEIAKIFKTYTVSNLDIKLTIARCSEAPRHSLAFFISSKKLQRSQSYSVSRFSRRYQTKCTRIMKLISHNLSHETKTLFINKICCRRSLCVSGSYISRPRKKSRISDSICDSFLFKKTKLKTTCLCAL